jgi:hypothetical protein
MKNWLTLLTICFLSMLLLPTHSMGEDRAAVGRIHRIDIKSQHHPRAYHPAVGDLVQCYLDFPILPDQIVVDLEVSIEGRPLSVVAVVSTSRPKIVGTGQISGYLLPRQAGLSKVKIQSMIPDRKTNPIEISFQVQPESRRR